jgi:hypothetical protein
MWQEQSHLNSPAALIKTDSFRVRIGQRSRKTPRNLEKHDVNPVIISNPQVPVVELRILL